MTPIIAGRFEQDSTAQQAIEALRQNGFAGDDITNFYVNPPGQHGTLPVGGDREASPGATRAHSGAIKGAALGTAVGLGVGLAATPLMGPAAVVAASAGAYAGSLAGALRDTDENPAPNEVDAVTDAPAAPGIVEAVKPIRNAGIVVAVRASEFPRRVAAVNVLRAAGARDIERADGSWESGQWTDFDPLKPPLLVDLPDSEEHAMRR